MAGSAPANTPIQPQSSQPSAIERFPISHENRTCPPKPASGISNSALLKPMCESDKRSPWPTPCHIRLIRSPAPPPPPTPHVSHAESEANKSHLQGFGCLMMTIEGLCPDANIFNLKKSGSTCRWCKQRATRDSDVSQSA